MSSLVSRVGIYTWSVAAVLLLLSAGFVPAGAGAALAPAVQETLEEELDRGSLWKVSALDALARRGEWAALVEAADSFAAGISPERTRRTRRF